MKLNIVHMFIQGGWVMYPIVALSIAAITITLERIVVILIQSIRLKPEKFVALFNEALERNNGDKIAAIDELMPVLKKKSSVCGSVLLTVFEKYKDGLNKRLNPVELRKWMSEAAESRAAVEMPALESHLSALAVISNVSTLMGLFGTVWGMIESFTAMANSPGGVKADEMAGGIAVALVATLGGLTVAIPSLLLYNYIRGFIEGFVVRIEETTIDTIDQLAV